MNRILCLLGESSLLLPPAGTGAQAILQHSCLGNWCSWNVIKSTHMHPFHLGHAEYILVFIGMCILSVFKVGGTLGSKAGESETGFYDQRDASVSELWLSIKSSKLYVHLDFQRTQSRITEYYIRFGFCFALFWFFFFRGGRTNYKTQYFRSKMSPFHIILQSMKILLEVHQSSRKSSRGSQKIWLPFFQNKLFLLFSPGML